MLRRAISTLLLGVCAAGLSADEPKPAVRPISEADSVLAVSYHDWTRYSPRPTTVILAAWADGRVVWSGDRLRGGPPYKEGRVEPKKVAALLARFEADGLFADEKLNLTYFDPHAEFLTVLVKSGKKRVEMVSFHELVEEAEGGIAFHWKLPRPDAKRRLDVLRDAPRDYLFYRVVWADTRTRLADLVPAEGRPTDGNAVMKAGDLSWHESAAPAQPKGPGRPPGK